MVRTGAKLVVLGDLAMGLMRVVRGVAMKWVERVEGADTCAVDLRLALEAFKTADCTAGKRSFAAMVKDLIGRLKIRVGD